MGFGIKTIFKAGKKLLNGNVLGAAGTLVGASIGSSASKKASKAQIAAQQAAIDEQRRQFDLTRQDLAPYRETGVSALSALAKLYGVGAPGSAATPDYSAFQNSPDYQFALSEGLKSVQGGAAARGGLYSGNAMRALQERGAGIASQNVGNYASRLAQLAGIGQGTAVQQGQLGAQYSGSVGNLLAGQGDARASGIVGSTNAIGGAINTLGQMAGDGAFDSLFRKKAGSNAFMTLNYRQPTLQRQV